MANWLDLAGTLETFFRIGLTGVRLKDSSGNLLVRNPGDSADAAITTSQLNNSSDSIVINSDAAGSGVDWLFTLSKNPAATAALTIQAPPAKGTDGFFLRQKASTSAGILELELASVSGSTNQLTVDTTSLVFGTTSPLTLFTLPANAIIQQVDVIVDTLFNGTPSLSVGISGTTSKYAPSTKINLGVADTYIFTPKVIPVGTTEALIGTYSAGGASAGAARIVISYTVPS